MRTLQSNDLAAHKLLVIVAPTFVHRTNFSIMTKRLLTAVLSLAVAGVVVPTIAAEPKKPAGEKYDKAAADKHVFLDPEKAAKEDPDFNIQGEYVGEAGGKKVGVQIAALGNGNFTALIYTGGLPGAGSEGKDAREGTGKADASKKQVAFTANGAEVASWGDGKVRSKLGDQSFEAAKVQRKSPTLGAKPPEGATVLFDGKNTDAWETGHMDERHLLAAGTKTKQKFQNFTLHVEFIEPFKPLGRDQDRGNSGIYIQERYEVQVLDSFGQKPVFNGTGALYRQTPPDLNMCLPPLQWQTYDIDFTAPTFENGKKTKNAVITVKLNGVAVHDKREITAKTGAGKPEGAEPGPILLQGHGNPVYYQNIWIVEKK
jgi:hypothetical protein